ncbi:hypothetical protein ARTHRO9AX_210073 [Arthrobacter sp. 9AX]|nr:hypothetical protein ARTHRO9AX_210073 [Arthrobacter sp. 9AX]
MACPSPSPSGASWTHGRSSGPSRTAPLAAVGFAGLLVFILRSEEVRGFLLNLIRTALALP